MKRENYYRQVKGRNLCYEYLILISLKNKSKDTCIILVTLNLNILS